MVSAHLFLIPCAVTFARGAWFLGAAAACVYLTSVLHWRHPRFSSIYRVLDYAAVLAAITTASVYALLSASLTWKLVWFCGFAAVAACFVVNELLYYKAMRRPFKSCLQRDWLFKRTVGVHLVAVHVGASTLATLLALDI